MSYVNPNFKTKKALQLALKNNAPVKVFQPGLGSVPTNGVVYLEGPHFPEPHKWYGVGTMRDGKLVNVK